MNIYTEPAMSDEAIRAMQVVTPATVFFISSLARIVDVSQLAIGDDEEDYFVPIPGNQLHEVSLRIARLESEVQERFNVSIRVLPIPMKVEDASLQPSGLRS
jgi:hypothetical protein